MRRAFLLLALASSIVPTFPAEVPPRNLSRLEIFNAGFPRTLLFRSSQIERWADEGRLESHLAPFNGDTRKYAGEETELRPAWNTIMAGFKQRHPGELSLIHLNGEARTAVRQEFQEKYFPGHWVYRPGELLKTDIDGVTTVIPVHDESLFSRHKFPMRRASQTMGEMLPSIILVPLGDDGSRRWEEAEYAQITATDPQRNTLTVSRGQYFSSARAFRAGRTYIAPMHCEHWGGNIMWTLNLSAACPRDPRGETAADICLREYREWCGPGGLAGHVDGIGFDVMYFRAKFPGWDLDNDGVAEDGIARDGRNFQLDGVYGFTKRLRAQMGDDFLLTSDGWEPNKQRAVGTFNGIESEGLCAPNDAWRKYAQTLNTHLYWSLHNRSKYQYSYITAKILHPADMPLQPQLYRMGLGTACVLGVSYSNTENAHRNDGRPMIAEMHRGQAEEANWLGMPLGPMVILPQRAPDLLAGNGNPFSSSLATNLRTKNCTVSVEPDGALRVIGSAENPYQPMEITLSGLRVTEGELTVFFEAMALEPLSGFEQTDGIPRLISVRADGLPKYTDQRGRRDFYNDFMGYMGTSGYAPVSAYFRRAGQGRGTIDLTLTFEQQGACKLRRLTAHNAPMAIAREFEKGVVLVNPAEEPIVFNLRQTLPQMKASGLWRLRANPASYNDSADAKAMLAYNDGRRENPVQIEVPPLNALFLTKEPPQQ